MGMGIERVSASEDGFEVSTPGARVSLSRRGHLEVQQRIGAERRLLTCQLPAHLSPWQMVNQTPFKCTFQGNGLRMTVQGDSVLVLTPHQHMRLSFGGHFMPHYAEEVRGNRLILDPLGGCGFFGIPPRPTELGALNTDRWTLDAHIARWDELWISFCPPRRREDAKWYEPVAHESTREEPYPSDEIIHSDAEHCRVFTLHEGWAKDAPDWVDNPPGASYKHPMPWETDHPVPADPRGFARVSNEARRSGMKLLVYFSPYYTSAPDLFSEMGRVLNEYELDGLYFDGWTGHRDDFRPGYHLMRRARSIIGNRVLYLHSSTEPFGTCRVYLPFVYAYADYVLSGEAGRDGLDKDQFLRYSVSGHQISNSVGMWCYYGSMGLPGYHNIVPTSEDIKKALENRVRFWRTAQAWSKMPDELARFDEEYYGALAQDRAKAAR